MNLSRCQFIARTTLTIAGTAWLTQLEAAQRSRLRIGSCAIGLPEAKEAGLDGVEVRVAKKPEDRLEITPPAVAVCEASLKSNFLSLSQDVVVSARRLDEDVSGH